MDAHEVVLAEWKECFDADGCWQPYHLTSSTRDDYYENTAYNNYPVIYIDWYQAVEYCEWMGKRLPTEAEWEKAARGGCELEGDGTCSAVDESIYSWGDESPTCELMNYCPAGTAPTCCYEDTIETGSLLDGQSPYGVQNLAGNVAEWVSDWFRSDYYSTSELTDPQGPSSGTAKVVKGGAWDSDADYCRNAWRGYVTPTMALDDIGFRCASDTE